MKGLTIFLLLLLALCDSIRFVNIYFQPKNWSELSCLFIEMFLTKGNRQLENLLNKEFVCWVLPDIQTY